MSPVRLVSPEEAKALLDAGQAYLDVRTEPEFEAGHPPGAYNVPLLHEGPSGLVYNEGFLAVVAGNFPKETPLVVGCQSGGRSRRAAETLVGAGYVYVVELGAGWDGKRDAFGRRQPGWCRRGLPVETGLPEGRSYVDLARRQVAAEPPETPSSGCDA